MHIGIHISWDLCKREDPFSCTKLLFLYLAHERERCCVAQIFPDLLLFFTISCVACTAFGSCLAGRVGLAIFNSYPVSWCYRFVVCNPTGGEWSHVGKLCDVFCGFGSPDYNCFYK